MVFVEHTFCAKGCPRSITLRPDSRSERWVLCCQPHVPMGKLRLRRGEMICRKPRRSTRIPAMSPQPALLSPRGQPATNTSHPDVRNHLLTGPLTSTRPPAPPSPGPDTDTTLPEGSVVKPESARALPLLKTLPGLPAHSESKLSLDGGPQGPTRAASCLTGLIPPVLPSPCSAVASLGSSFFLQQARCAPASGPLHLLFSAWKLFL